MKKVLFSLASLTLVAVLVFSLASCSTNSGDAETTAPVTEVQTEALTDATDATDTSTASAADAATCTIELEGNPTTGYEWTATIEDDGILSLVSDTYTADETDDEMVGVGGKYAFVFKGVAPGETTVTFNYARSWESVMPEETKTYTFTVAEDLSVTYEDITVEEEAAE